KRVYWKVSAIDTAFKQGSFCSEQIAGSLFSRIISLEPSEGMHFLRYGKIKGEAHSSGTEKDALDRVEIRIKNTVSYTYWDGAQWTESTNNWITVIGKEEWEYDCKGKNMGWHYGEKYYVETRPVLLKGEIGLVSEKVEFIPVYQLEENSFCNYPNPFNPNKESTCIEYLLSRNENVKLLVYSIDGRISKDWKFNEGTEGGRMGINRIYWDGKNNNGYTIANGVYFCYLKYPGVEKMIKILVIK
ncbi:MAG: hypothetical protein KKH98_06870, partial [Spirochaetes bacterium]|nr:hypothetical protein [Spirochaetota bacterium]